MWHHLQKAVSFFLFFSMTALQQSILVILLTSSGLSLKHFGTLMIWQGNQVEHGSTGFLRSSTEIFYILLLMFRTLEHEVCQLLQEFNSFSYTAAAACFRHQYRLKWNLMKLWLCMRLVISLLLYELKYIGVEKRWYHLLFPPQCSVLVLIFQNLLLTKKQRIH